MCAGACSRAGFVCMMVAMALKLHILEPVLSFVLGTMEVVMQFGSVVSRAQARSLYSHVRQLCFAETVDDHRAAAGPG